MNSDCRKPFDDDDLWEEVEEWLTCLCDNPNENYNELWDEIKGMTLAEIREKYPGLYEILQTPKPYPHDTPIDPRD